MKKLIAALLALTLLLSLSACGNNENQSMEAPITETTAPVVDQTTGDSTDSTESIPNVTVSEETQPATKPEATQPTETTPTESTPAETKPDTQPTTPSTPSGMTPTEPKPTEPKPTEPKPTEPKPTDGNHEHDYGYRKEKTYTYCTESGYEYLYCSCGKYLMGKHNPQNHSYSRKVISQATHDKEGQAELSCLWCPYTTTEVIPKVNVPYFVGFEIVSVERPNAYYLSNGQDLLTRLYGKNQAFQKGDSLVLKVVMSDGGNDFELKNYIPRCTCTKDGNLIYVAFDADYPSVMSEASVTIEVSNKDGEKKYQGLIFHIWGEEQSLGISSNCTTELRVYAKRLGMQWVSNGTDFVEKYNGGYTWKDESLSVTGCTIKGTDDLIPVTGNPDWIEEAIHLLDTYASMGFTKINFSVYGGAFTTLAE